jgi:hypothetical protein
VVAVPVLVVVATSVRAGAGATSVTTTALVIVAALVVVGTGFPSEGTAFAAVCICCCCCLLVTDSPDLQLIDPLTPTTSPFRRISSVLVDLSAMHLTTGTVLQINGFPVEKLGKIK